MFVWRMRVFVVDCFRTWIHQLLSLSLRIGSDILRSIRGKTKWSFLECYTMILEFKFHPQKVFFCRSSAGPDLLPTTILKTVVSSTSARAIP